MGILSFSITASISSQTLREAKEKFGAGNLIRQSRENDYTVSMSYLTMEVEIDHGKVVTKGPSKLPEKASGLLTIFQPETSETSKLTPLQALDALQKYLRLDTARAAEWMTTVREARR
jgi:hypothetical protein